MKTFKEFLNSKTQNIETYEYEGGFYFDVSEIEGKHGKEYNAWLYHEDYGIKSLIFGVLAENTSKEDFLFLVPNNIDDDISYYIEQYFD